MAGCWKGSTPWIHNLYDEELKVYQDGVKKFGTSAWYDRLARWHLRHKGQAAFRALPTFEDLVRSAGLSPVYRGEGVSVWRFR